MTVEQVLPPIPTRRVTLRRTEEDHVSYRLECKHVVNSHQTMIGRVAKIGSIPCFECGQRGGTA